MAAMLLFLFMCKCGTKNIELYRALILDLLAQELVLGGPTLKHRFSSRTLGTSYPESLLFRSLWGQPVSSFGGGEVVLRRTMPQMGP